MKHKFTCVPLLACLLFLPLTSAAAPVGMQKFSLEALRSGSANQTIKEEELQKTTLRELVDDDFPLPGNLANVMLDSVKSDKITIGKTWLNGIATTIAMYTPAGSKQPNLAIAHKQFAIKDYIPDIEGTELEKTGNFTNTVFIIAPDDNLGLLPGKQDGISLARILGSQAIKDYKTRSRVSLIADADLAQLPDGPIIAEIMRLDSTMISIASELDEKVFVNVNSSTSAPQPLYASRSRTLEKLMAAYGDSLITGTRFTANAGKLVGTRFGPATITAATWDIYLGLESTIGMRVNLDMPVAKTKEIFQAREVDIQFDIQQRRLTLNGKVARDKTEKLVDAGDLTLSRAVFEGELTVKENAADLALLKSYDAFDFKVDGNGTIPSKARSNAPVSLQIALNLDDEGAAVIPKLIIEGSLKLSDLIGKNLVSTIADPELTKVEVTTDYQAGWSELYGAEIYTVRYQAEDDSYPVIGMHHEALDLGTYIPNIRGTSLGSFGLTNASFLILPENADSNITYKALKDVPEPLQSIVDTDVPDMFPLTLLPGVNVIGIYGTADDGGNAATVMRAYGIDEQGYVVKGNFKLIQLRNATFGKTDIPNPIKGNEKAICNAVLSPDISGLDISFPIPGFQPPYTGKSFTFNNSRFSLKEIDGQIEPSILTGMNITLPEDKVGIKSLNMAGKFSVQGDLNQLCNKVTKESDLRVSYAASTAFNTTAISDIAFAALERVTTREQDDKQTDTTGDSDSSEAGEDAQAEDIAIADAIEESKQAPLGWKKAFGLPFLEIRQFASSGTFEQKSGEQSLSWEVWTDSQVGTETLDMHGSMDVKIGEASLDVENWSFSLPGPVNVGGLPGLKEIPKANELVLYDIDLSNETMSGRIEWPKQQTSGSAYLIIGEDDQQQPEFELFARLDKFALSMMRASTSSTDGIPDVTGIPNSVWQQNIGPVVMGLRNKDRETLTLDDDTPEKLLQLFTGRENANIENQSIKLLDKGDNLLLAKGVTLAGMFNASEIKNQTIRNAILDLGLTNSIPLTGAIEKDDNNKFQAQLTASTPAIKPSSSIDFLSIKPSFGNARLLISTLDDGEFGIESNANITLGQENIAMTGMLSLKPDESGNLVKDDWLFRAPGPINIGGLPGLGELPKFKQMALLDIELTPNEMSGRIDWPAQNTSGSAWFTRTDNNELAMFARLDRFYPNMLLDELPAAIGNKTVSPAIIAWRNHDREELTLNEATPANLALLLGGDSDTTQPYRKQPLLSTGDSITLAKGLTMAGRTDFEELKKIQQFNLLLQRIRITNAGLLLTGAFEKDDAGKFIGEISATLTEFEIPEIPKTTIKFQNTRLLLSNLEDDKITLHTHAQVTPPLPKKLNIPMNGVIEFTHKPQSDTLHYQLTVPEKLAAQYKIPTPGIWANPPALPDMEIANVGFDGSVQYKLNETLHDCAIVGDARVDALELRVKVDICNGRNPSVVLSDPNYDPILYIEDEIRLSRLLRGVTDLAGKKSGDQQTKRQLDELNKLLGYVGDAAMSKILISRNAFSGHTDINILNRANIKGRAALARDDGKYALFVRNNKTTELSSKEVTMAVRDLLPVDMPPLDQIKISRGLFIMSTQSTDDFNLDKLPIDIFDDMFEGLLEKDRAEKIRVSDGLTFLTKSNTTELPVTIRPVVSTLGMSGDFILGGALGDVSSQQPSIAMYIALSDVDAPLPDFAGEIIEIKDANAELFIETGGPGQEVEVGFSTDATLKMPRLDKPGNREAIDTTITVAYKLGGTSGGGVEVAAEVKGEWNDPMGLEDFSLTDTRVGIGVEGNGTTIAINSKEAVFKDKRFVLDLDSAWAGAVPTQLAVQFAKSPNHQGDFIIDPLTQIELVNSIFKVALKSGSALANSIKSQLPNQVAAGDLTPAFNDPVGRFTNYSQMLASTSDNVLKLMKESPLGMVGIKNPQIFFVTPGDSLPPREGIDRPPLGLGLVSKGQLVLHAGDLRVDIAAGEYNINLRDGYMASGSITPPSPFQDSSLTISGSQSLITMTPAGLEINGRLALPGNIPVIDKAASISGEVNAKRTDTGASISGGVSVAGLKSRSTSFNINHTSMHIYSPPGGCVDVPIKIDGRIAVNQVPNPGHLISFVQPVVPDVLDCLSDLGKAVAEVAGAVADGASAAAEATAEAAQAAAEETAAAVEDIGNATADVANDALNGLNDALKLDDVGNTIGDAWGTATSWMSGESEYCNDRIRAVRSNGIRLNEPTTRLMWERLEGLWVAGKQSEAIKSRLITAETRVKSTQETFLELASSWNDFAYNSSPDFYVDPVWKYHNAGQSRALTTPIDQRDTWYYNDDYEYDMNYQYRRISRKNQDDQSTEDYLKAIKHWQQNYEWERQDADGRIWSYGDLDNVHKRCQRVWAMGELMKAAFSIGAHDLQSNVINTDAISRSELDGTLNKLGQAGTAFRNNNTTAIQYLKELQVNAVKRNVQFIADLKQKMHGAIDKIRDRTSGNTQLAGPFSAALFEADTAVDQLYEHNLNVIKKPNGATDSDKQQSKALMQSALDRIGEILIAEVQYDLDRLNRYWSSTEQQSMIIFPYIKKCLRSKFRPDNNNPNPLYVSDCEPNLQRILDDIEEGIAHSADSWQRHLETNYVDAKKCLAEGYAERLHECPHKHNVQDLRWQFWLWDAEQENTARLATAVSVGNHPGPSYCLGVPESFAPRAGTTTVKAAPCTTGNKSQLWRKLPDEGGASYFRLRNEKYGLCATWNGAPGINETIKIGKESVTIETSGVDAIVLEPCEDKFKNRQVMNAGWPLRDADTQPVLLTGGKPKLFKLLSTTFRCLHVHNQDGKGLNTTAFDGNCGNKGLVNPAPIPNGKVQLQFRHDNQTTCLVSTDKYANIFDGKPVDKNTPNAYRVAGNGYCHNKNSEWEIIPAPNDLYAIREAHGDQACLWIRYAQWSKMPKAMPIFLRECKFPADGSRLFAANVVDNPPFNSWDEPAQNTFKRTVTGSVTASSSFTSSGNTPLANMLVNLKSSGQSGLHVASTRTDQSGKFTFDALSIEAGDYVIEQPLPEGFTYISDSDDDNAADGKIALSISSGGNSANNNFVLGQGKTISGTVRLITKSGSSPMPGQTLTLQDNKSSTTDPTVTTDSEGKYSFDFVPPGNYTIVKTLQAGYTDQVNSDGQGNGKITVKMAKDNLDGQDFVMLPEAKTISGIVTYDYSGNTWPLPNVKIALQDSDSRSVLQQTQTGADGRYYFYDVADRNYTIVKSDTNGYANLQDTDEVNDGQITLTIDGNSMLENNFKLRRLSSITGRIKTPLGGGQFKYHKNVKVSLSAVNNTDFQTREVRTDSNGRYMFEDFPAGRYHVRVTAPTGYLVRSKREFWIGEGVKKVHQEGDNQTDFPICGNSTNYWLDRVGGTPDEKGQSDLWCRQINILDGMPQL